MPANFSLPHLKSQQQQPTPTKKRKDSCEFSVSFSLINLHANTKNHRRATDRNLFIHQIETPCKIAASPSSGKKRKQKNHFDEINFLFDAKQMFIVTFDLLFTLTLFVLRSAPCLFLLVIRAVHSPDTLSSLLFYFYPFIFCLSLLSIYISISSR